MLSDLFCQINPIAWHKSGRIPPAKKRFHKVIVIRNVSCLLFNQRLKNRKLLVSHRLDALAREGRLAKAWKACDQTGKRGDYGVSGSCHDEWIVELAVGEQVLVGKDDCDAGKIPDENQC